MKKKAFYLFFAIFSALFFAQFLLICYESKMRTLKEYVVDHFIIIKRSIRDQISSSNVIKELFVFSYFLFFWLNHIEQLQKRTIYKYIVLRTYVIIISKLN